MKKMKKWELLKKAYETYPAGTIARFKSAPRVEHVSDGTFRITKDSDNGICVVNESDTSCFYASRDSNTGEEIEEWAIPDEIHEPKKEFVITSKDGVDLYENDEYFKIIKCVDSKWRLQEDLSLRINRGSGCIFLPDKYKAFSTKEAAEKWILEANRPKSITIGENSQYPVIVTATEATIKCIGDIHKDNIILWPGEINEIADAIEELNRQS